MKCTDCKFFDAVSTPDSNEGVLRKKIGWCEISLPPVLHTACSGEPTCVYYDVVYKELPGCSLGQPKTPSPAPDQEPAEGEGTLPLPFHPL